LDVAVTVAVPTDADVTKPELEIVATLVGEMVQATDGWLAVLPSLFVPDTVICTVLLVLPVSMVGDAGPTEIDVSVGFWKNPVQLTPTAAMASTARDAARRSLCFADDIAI
jgi:hypothetical protein